MKILSNYNNYKPSFQKRASTRKADDIVRQVRNNYPAVSLSNILENWKRPYKPADKEEDEKWRRSLRRLDDVLDYVREDGRLSPKNPIFEEQVTKIKRFKTANCAEYAYLSLNRYQLCRRLVQKSDILQMHTQTTQIKTTH